MYGLTNGVYLSCKSFRTAKRPIATVTLMHSSLPLSVIGTILREQQNLWVGEHAFEFPERLQAGALWPRDVPFADRIEHPNRHRYAIRGERRGYAFYGEGQGDLPVFREAKHRIHGSNALLGSALTFAPRKAALDTHMPSVDVSRHVCDAIIDHWTRMCGVMRSRVGAAKVGLNLLASGGAGYKTSGIQHTQPALRPQPLSIQWMSPDLAHCVGLNSAVACLYFVKEMAMKTDSRLVRTCPLNLR